MEKDNGLPTQEHSKTGNEQDQLTTGGISHQSPGTATGNSQEMVEKNPDDGNRPQMQMEGPGAKPSDAELVQQLIEMGFREDLSKKAIEQTKDLQEAANLILIFEENDSGNIAAPTKAQVKELFYKMVKPPHSGDSCQNRYQNDTRKDGSSSRPWGPWGLQTCSEK